MTRTSRAAVRERTMRGIGIGWKVATVLAGGLVCLPAQADAVTDWNTIACDILVVAEKRTPHANRIMALVHTAIYEAANAATGRYPSNGRVPPAPGASPDAAVAAAGHAVLLQLLPSQRAAIDQAYQRALAGIADSPARAAGIAAGERAAVAVLAARGEDHIDMPETYRPFTQPGVYVPTAMPAVLQWPQRKPWLMSRAAQFRPGPPPSLDSAQWARDYNEIKALGGKQSTQRSADQTAAALFWEATLPPVYHGVVRSVALAPGRDLTRNARLFMAVTQATDDAVIAVFDAKHHYNFWRPVTAIRNGDRDGNDATERDPGWLPLIETPMHPEYPCAHCIVSSAIGTVLKADLGDDPAPRLASTSDAAKAERSWTSIDAFVQEVSEARILDGVHFRTSTVVGADMGAKIGALAAEKYLQAH